MKQKDLMLVIVMVFIGAIFSFVVSNALFGSPSKRQQKAEVVDVISPDFPDAPDKYFNSKSLNPTLHIAAPAEGTAADSNQP